jgi:hypothetical protein
MTDLLPCPFCGSTNLRFTFAGSQGYICCDNCGTQGPCDEQAADPICDYDAAYTAWNRRPAPVSVSERLPGPEDCLDEGWAWFFSQRIGWRQAVLPVSPGYTHWLPAHALPLPTPEATND